MLICYLLYLPVCLLCVCLYTTRLSCGPLPPHCPVVQPRGGTNRRIKSTTCWHG